ncbi:undecaprenyl-diphosphatase [Bacillus massiliigorillae]|uniref:undecaprenyl-diphosphatase n=1 Tax=Bacillus massiliigorillae TaxID=1243664 RepID=UPI0003A835C5|nr:undecaprenyl-diphosphatase [Bacillus massiliigorillae]
MNSELNVRLFRAVNDLGIEYSFLNPVFVFLAEYMVYVLLIAVILFWFTRTNRNRIMIISAGISFILAEVLGKLAGKIHSNQQPFAELENVNKLIEKTVGNSFPSDHTILFFAFCFTFFLFNKRFKYIWLILAFLVAISRMWVGVHYPFDVTAGAIIAIISAFICYQIVPRSVAIKKLLGFYENCEQKIVPRKDQSNNF